MNSDHIATQKKEKNTGYSVDSSFSLHVHSTLREALRSFYYYYIFYTKKVTLKIDKKIKIKTREKLIVILLSYFL